MMTHNVNRVNEGRVCVCVSGGMGGPDKHSFIIGRELEIIFINLHSNDLPFTPCFSLSLFQGVSGALAVLMKDAIKPTLMQTLEVSHSSLL